MFGMISFLGITYGGLNVTKYHQHCQMLAHINLNLVSIKSNQNEHSSQKDRFVTI